MKLYKARIRGTGAYLTFDGEVLHVSDPVVFEVLLEYNQTKVAGMQRLKIEDLEIVESEWEKIHEY